MGKRYRNDGRSETVACWHRIRILQREKAETNCSKTQIFNFGNVLRKLVQLKGITDGGLGANPPAVGRFFVIF